MRSQTSWRAAALSALVLIAAGCDTDVDPDTTGGPSTDLCADVTCGTNEVCDPVDGQCLLAIEACETTSDCDDDTMKCSDGACVANCTDVVCDTDHGELCDPETGDCVGGFACDVDEDCDVEAGSLCQDGGCVGTRYSSCNQTQPCMEGLDCLNAGFGGVCAEPCETSAECIPYEVCNDAGLYDGHCNFNPCRPGGDPGLDGFQDAPYMGPCNVDGTGDGVCLGPLMLGTEPGGVCVGHGTAQPGDACDVNEGLGSALACDNGWCIGDPGSSICVELCAPFDAASCGDLFGAPATCVPIFGLPGVCLPQSVPAVDAGLSCNPSPPDGTLPCIEDYTCVPAGGPTNTCEPYCDLAAGPTDPGACPAGTCTQIDPMNPFLGACI